MPRRLLPMVLIIALLGSLALASSAAALTVGIGDQKTEVFGQKLFQDLRFQRVRLIYPVDAIDNPRLKATYDAWIQKARGDGKEILVAFNVRSDNRCPRSPCPLPTLSSYKKTFDKFRAAYPYIKLYQPWNEVNNPTQPTAKNPKRAAQYYNYVKSKCRGCKVLAADVQDISNQRKWVRSFLKYTKGTPKLWGLHNYTDVNRFRTSGTAQFLKLVKGKVWLTETGGVYFFETQSGRVNFPKSLSRTGRATKQLFKIARKFKSRIDRIYLYNWQSDAGQRFDSGVVNPDGTARPTYDLLKGPYRKYIR